MYHKFIYLALFLLCTSNVIADEKVPMKYDINSPVENPNLVKALKYLARNPTTQAKDNVLKELNHARYLIPIIKKDIKESKNTGDNSTTWEAGSKVSVLVIKGPDNNFYIPLFTDWPTMANYYNKSVDAFVFSAKDAWDYSVNVFGYNRVVVNPGGDTLPLNEIQLKYLIENAK